MSSILLLAPQRWQFHCSASQANRRHITAALCFTTKPLSYSSQFWQ